MADVLLSLQREGHLRDAHCVTGFNFLKDLQRSHGSSDGLVGMMSDKVDASFKPSMAPPGAGNAGGLDQLDFVLSRLRSHERNLLKYLVEHRELPRGGLLDWARQHCNYTTQKTAKAFAVGRIQSMLESMAEIYPRAPSPTR